MTKLKPFIFNMVQLAILDSFVTVCLASCAGQKLTPASSPVREVTSGFSPLEHTWHPDQEHEIPTKKPRLNFPSPKIVIPGDAGNEAVVTGKVSYNH
jgi:hypothetical protein